MDAVEDAARRRAAASGYGARGFAARYDANRPRTPTVLLELLPFVAAVRRPGLVVDLGSGTGLSTRPWSAHADSVVGVEPNAEMRRYAETVTDSSNVRYLDATSHATGLPDGCADIVTCAQSCRWMEPEPTFAEVARVLRPGGVFAAYDYQSLTTRSPELDAAWRVFREGVANRRLELGLDRDEPRPSVAERVEHSGVFRHTGETAVHSIETEDAARFMGVVLSEGSVTTLLERVDEQTLGLDRLRRLAQRGLGDEPAPWYLGYRVVLGVR